MDSNRPPRLAETTIGACDHVLFPNDTREILDSPGHELRVLYNVSGMCNYPGYDYFPVRQPDVFPYHPLVFVSRVGSLSRIGLGVNL